MENPSYLSRGIVDSAGDRYQVVVHVDADVSAETSRRLACDSSRVVMTHGRDHGVLGVGRKTRAIHPALRRALQHRDGGCRFPGCGSQICDAHHVEPWAEGGKTELDNLLLLCRFHHRALHEGGFRVQLNREGTSRFFTPRGARIPEAPPAPVLTSDPVEVLTRVHEAAGIEIDEWTGFPQWQGEILDLAHAIDALHQAVQEGSGSLGFPDSRGRLLRFEIL